MTLSPAVVPSALSEAVQDALGLLSDEATPIEDRAALYAAFWNFQIRVNRVLRKAKDPLVVHMETNGLRDMGPLSVKSTAVDVRWPVNDPDNWDDAALQDELEMFARMAPDYFRRVPEHWELLTAALGAGVASGDPVAQKLHRHAKEQRWRTESHRNLSLAVKEARP